MSAEDAETDFLAFPSPMSSREDLSVLSQLRIATSSTTTRNTNPEGSISTSSNSKPRFISRLLTATKSYKSSTTSKARKLFNAALNISISTKTNIPPKISKIPVDRYLPTEIHLQIFSYLPWETLLACSLASNIWSEILLHHGQDHSLLKHSKDRYTAPRKHIGILYHKIFYHRPCKIGISKSGIESIKILSRSPWEPIHFAINRSKLRRQKSNFSILSSGSSSSSDDSSADVACNDDQGEGKRVVVSINPHDNFVMNDVLLKLNPIYTPKPTLMARLLAVIGRDIPDEYQIPYDSSIELDIVITSQDETDNRSKRIGRTLETDVEREGITLKTFLEYVIEVVAEETAELEEGEGRTFFVSFLMIKDRNISFAVYLDGWKGSGMALLYP
ncbi:hypothetical protein TWF506_000076 [Arthrobotrys conoides]|uniref:F-box domain-containing protein n=1 Tax=Arthrobotrys conoides TaxID=74498 RepID=A0AAN8S408_9PEZI